MKIYLTCGLILIIALFSNLSISAQIKVSGSIADRENGEPLIGVTVAEKGTSNGVLSDFDGNFELEVTSEASVLQFSYVGMRTVERVVGDQRSFNIVMESASELLDEVVVVGYETKTRSKITGSVSTLSSEEIANKPVLRAEQALQGETAGVQVAATSGSPGSALTVRIRGVSTINNSDPLFIVDGIPVDGIDYLNPGDIESISVLKDAASAAIYGARGGNGVVLITTKTGAKSQEGTIEYRGYYGVQSAPETMDLLNGTEYATLANEARINSGLVPLPQFQNPQRYGEGTNWQDALFQTAPMTNHELSFRGGSEKSSYRVSGAYFNQEGIVGGEKSGFERYTASINTRTELKPWLNIGNNLNFTYLERDFLLENNEFNTPLLRALNIDPVTPVRKPDGTFAYSEFVTTDIANPLNQIENTFDQWTSHRLVGSVFGDIQFTEQLKWTNNFGVDATFAQRDGFSPIFDLSIDPDLRDAPATERNDVNTVSSQRLTWRKYQWESYLNYSNNFGDHGVSAILGTTFINGNYRFLGGANTGLPSNDPNFAFIANTIDQGASNSAGDDFFEESWNSYFGKLSYDYKGRYVVTFTSRVDGSSRFGPDNRYGYFPSASVAWLPSMEDFWTSDAISVLKLRVSWGRNGNDRIGNYAYTSRIFAGQNYTFGPDETITTGNGPQNASNPELKWEVNEQLDIGVDIEFLDGKFEFVADYYNKKTIDMLYAVDIPSHVGIGPPIQNIGNVQTSGLDLSLVHRGSINDFSYSVRGNLTTLETEITSLGGGEATSTAFVFPTGSNVVQIDVGLPIGGFWGYQTDGIFQTQEEVNNHAFQNELTAPGDIRFRDINNDGVIDQNDRTLIGDPNPDLIFGFNVGGEYKGFDLNIFAQGTSGNDIFNGIFRYDFPFTNRPASALNRWTGPGTSNEVPRIAVGDPNQNARASDRYVEDGSYLRLKTIQLGYTLPQSISQRIKLRKCRFYVTGQNLLTFTNYSGLDPEIGTNPGNSVDIGIDRGFYPQSRTVLFGLDLTL